VTLSPRLAPTDSGVSGRNTVAEQGPGGSVVDDRRRAGFRLRTAFIAFLVLKPKIRERALKLAPAR